MKNAAIAFGAVAALAIGTAAAGPVNGLLWVCAVAVPYTAFAIFLFGFAWKVMQWSLAPVPFRIPTVCGQQKSLPWIKSGWLESPWTTAGVVARMTLEVLLFRSLFRNTRSKLDKGPRLIYAEDKLLWLGALAFHWSLLIVLLRHLRFFVEPVPTLAVWLDAIDGFFQIGAPGLYVTDVAILAGLGFLLQRRVRDPQLKYISLFTDYFALFLLLGIALSGAWMRYFVKADVVAVKQLAIGLTVFAPVLPKDPSAAFLIHLALVSTLAAYLPFSKLMHMGGVFLSPTRNLANNNRMKRHINPWNSPVKVHSYEEWEDEFREKIEAAGLPVEKH